jgi:hypothetical protein
MKRTLGPLYDISANEADVSVVLQFIMSLPNICILE